MKCAYCLEDMNEGATVCRVCGRQQPPTAAQRTKRNRTILLVLLFAVPASVLICLFGWLGFDHYERSAAVESVYNCARLHGDTATTRDLIDWQLDELSNGQGWRTGEMVVRIQYRCP